MSEPEFQNTMPTSGEFWVMHDRYGRTIISDRYYWCSPRPNYPKYLYCCGNRIDEKNYPKTGLFITGILHKE